MSERILAIIPARGGSKRLPGKNVRLLGNKPLIAWSIASGINSGLFCDVMVTTDDTNIAEIAKAEGALVPWLRPVELATDTATTSAVLHHALTRYEEEQGTVDAVTLLQPTSPFRRRTSLLGAVETYLSPSRVGCHSIVSVSPVDVPPEWCFRMSDDVLEPILGWNAVANRSQDLQPAFRLNGSIYVISAQAIRQRLPLISPGTRGYLMEAEEESIDIDNEEDWKKAESFLPIVEKI